MGNYSRIQTHLGMNFDPVRNAAYARAIRAAVTANSVVLDLGAGLGLLGLIAARAGARKVYLVEPEPVIEVTRKVVEGSGFENVECIQSTAEGLQLPERVDVIVSVMTGNFLLTEDLLPTLFRARDRLLAPGGVLIPDSGRMWVVPVSCKDYYRKNIDDWSRPRSVDDPGNTFGVDYSPARPYVANSLFYDTPDRLDARWLAAPACLRELDFLTANTADCDSRINSEIATSGQCDGWLGWFDMRLRDEWLSTAPDAEAMHWRQVFLPLERPLSVEMGHSVTLRLKRPEQGEWTWITEHDGESQRQSTFLSTPLGPDTVLRRSEHHQPHLNRKGEAVRAALERMDGTVSSGELADRLIQEFPGVFHSREEALRQVRALAEKFSGP